jgi:hypothetical protein
MAGIQRFLNVFVNEMGRAIVVPTHTDSRNARERLRPPLMAADFFVVPTGTYQQLFVLVIVRVRVRLLHHAQNVVAENLLTRQDEWEAMTGAFDTASAS